MKEKAGLQRATATAQVTEIAETVGQNCSNGETGARSGGRLRPRSWAQAPQKQAAQAGPELVSWLISQPLPESSHGLVGVGTPGISCLFGQGPGKARGET